jgi:hypothetical protein
MAKKYTSSYCNVIRAKIILLADEGLSNDVIASRLDTPRQIVSKWRKRSALPRLPGLEVGVRPAFPPVSSFRLRHSPASFLPPSGSHCPGSRSSKSASRAPLCGDGSVAIPFAPGNIEAGSSHCAISAFCLRSRVEGLALGHRISGNFSERTRLRPRR